MRVVAAIPAAGLLAGCALGLYWADGSAFIPVFFLIVSAAGVVHAVRGGRELLLAIAIAAGFCSGGALHARAAWRDAWRPTLREAPEATARGQRADARRAGTTGTGADGEAVPRSCSSVSCGRRRRARVAACPADDVRWIGRAGSLRAASIRPPIGRWRCLLTVVGALAERAHATGAKSRPPGRRADPSPGATWIRRAGPGQALARRGIGWSASRAVRSSGGEPRSPIAGRCRFRTFARRAIRAGSMGAQSRRNRHSGVVAIARGLDRTWSVSSGRDVSRHRDFRQQHRDSGRPTPHSISRRQCPQASDAQRGAG